MSSMDQAFVKAFSRRRLADVDRQAGSQATQDPTVHLRADLSQQIQTESERLGSEADCVQTINSELWSDPATSQVARTDQADFRVPNPHVDTFVAIDYASAFGGAMLVGADAIPESLSERSGEPLPVQSPEPVLEPSPQQAQTASPDGATTYVPFQAVWEVDVFDVPNVVAELFFEGALFQQIAERMSDAVASGLRRVLVTSGLPGEGRSSVAIGMAMAAAAAGIRVALVDADIESPSLADELRLDLQYGWIDVIRRGVPIKEIAVHAVEDEVTLIPLMPPGVRPMATVTELNQLIDVLANHFELIILDGPTRLSRGLEQCVSRVDSVVIVRDASRTTEAELARFAHRLQDAGVRGVGVVENFVVVNAALASTRFL